MCAVKNVGKVITTENSGTPPVQREFFLSEFSRGLGLDSTAGIQRWIGAQALWKKIPGQTCTFRKKKPHSYHISFIRTKSYWESYLGSRPTVRGIEGMGRKEMLTGWLTERFSFQWNYTKPNIPRSEDKEKGDSQAIKKLPRTRISFVDMASVLCIYGIYLWGLL